MDSAKLQKNIESVECELKSLLVKCASRAAETGDDFFSNTRYSQYQLSRTNDTAEKLLGLSIESIELHEQASLDSSKSAASLYLDACKELADIENKHRRGPRKLSAWIAMELSSVDAM